MTHQLSGCGNKTTEPDDNYNYPRAQNIPCGTIVRGQRCVCGRCSELDRLHAIEVAAKAFMSNMDDDPPEILDLARALAAKGTA